MSERREGEERERANLFRSLLAHQDFKFVNSMTIIIHQSLMNLKTVNNICHGDYSIIANLNIDFDVLHKAVV